MKCQSCRDLLSWLQSVCREIICWVLTVNFIMYLLAQAGVFYKSGNRIRISNGMSLSLMCPSLDVQVYGGIRFLSYLISTFLV